LFDISASAALANGLINWVLHGFMMILTHFFKEYHHRSSW
jgi:hypothetical protein